MNTEICRMLGIDFPLFAFSHCRDVVVAVSRAGGFGVLGAARFSAQELEVELDWIDRHSAGRPYGVDLLLPENQPYARGTTVADMAAEVPAAHRVFVADLLRRHDIVVDAAELVQSELPYSAPEVGSALMDVAFRHPIRLIVSALGIAPAAMVERARANDVRVAALVGAKEHAIRQLHAGVDILVAQGTEAGGHCGEVSTLVLLPEVLRAIAPIRPVPVLAAGGIMTGRQMAGCMAMGAAGAWTGSVWLATTEAETTETFREKLLAASARDTVRSRYRTGKPSRQLRSTWHDAWEAPGSPPALPMPLMTMIATPAFERIDKAAGRGNAKAKELVSYFVGQGVGLIDSVKSATQVVQEFKSEFADAIETLTCATSA